MTEQKQRAFYFRRQHKRRAIDIPVGTICRDQGYFETALELSEGGILVRSDFEYRVGDSAELCFFIPEVSFVAELAEVVYVIDCHSSSRLVGLRFPKPSEEAAASIRTYVDLEITKTNITPFRRKDSDLIYGSKAQRSR
jgi:Tfp pilus assembly protein PilZ